MQAREAKGMDVKKVLILVAIRGILFAAARYFNPVHSTEVFVDLAEVAQSKLEASEAPRDPELKKAESSAPPGANTAIGMLVPTNTPNNQPPTQLPTRRMTAKVGDSINIQIDSKDLPYYNAYARNGLLKRTEEGKPAFRFKAEQKGREYLYFYCHAGMNGLRDEYPQCLIVVDIQ